MSLFHSRRKGKDAHLEWKVRIFVVAAVLGLGGMYFGDRRLTIAAVALLAATLLLRFVSRAVPEEADVGAEQDGSDHEGG